MFFKTILFLFLTLSVFAQVAPNKYWVQFTDKNGSPFLLSNPQGFLSQRSIDRRSAQNITYNNLDIPVNPSYINSVSATGATVLNKSKWLNGVLVETTNASQLLSIQALSFVAFTKSIKNYLVSPETYNINKFINEVTNEQITTGSTEYGSTYNQTAQVRGESLHANGYTGEGMLIAVLDDGFRNCNTLGAFTHLYNNNKIKATWDFVDNNSNVYDDGAHGTMVFSVMGAKIPNNYIGTATDADYLLLRTENSNNEYVIEEYNWLCAAEFADSAGADIINSSLAYNVFNTSTQNHSYNDMDGKTTIITKAANWAASKGILVVNSAGNEGQSGWKYICAPADADSVLTVGAVDINDNYYAISSTGPTADGRIKPNVCALGNGASVISYTGSIQSSNGTSFSSPIVAGMAACLWQANPTLSNMEIFSYIVKSASQFANPNNTKGYGVPNFGYAWFLITDNKAELASVKGIQALYPNPFSNELNIVYFPKKNETITIQLLNNVGKVLYKNEFNTKANTNNTIKIPLLENFAKGVYILQLSNSTEQITKKIVKF